jgi:DNA-binding transcriptional LysR family regulator
MFSLDLTQLDCFSDVVELGSFTAAAKRRGITQPAVSMQVHGLERRLGVRLVERVGWSVAPTRAGVELLHHARSVRAEVELAIAAVAPHKAHEVGRVRLGTGATVCIHLLPPLLYRLRKCHPGIEITVQTGNSGDIVQRVEEGALDAGLVTLPIRSRSLDVTEVYADELVAVFPPGARVPDEPIPAAALTAWPLVLYEPGGNTRSLIDQWLKAADVLVQPTMELGSIEAIKEMVGAGLGASVLPLLAVQRADQPARLIIRSFANPLTRTLGVVVRRDRVLDWALREFLKSTRQLPER